MLTLSVASLTSVAIFVVVVYSCWRMGLFSTLVMLFVIVMSAATATALLVPVSNLLTVAGMGWYTQPICFMSVFLLSMVILQTGSNYLFPPRLAMPKAMHRGGAAVLGLVNAYLLTGALMIGFCLFPGTGGPPDKVIFPSRVIGADVFFTDAMKWMSRQAGSVTFPADDFLDSARREKYRDSVKQRSDTDIEIENSECFINLHRLGSLIDKYVGANARYPRDLQDLFDYLPSRRTEKQREKMLRCPVTGFRYVLFPLDDYRLVKGDSRYVLIYDRVPGKYGPAFGHLKKGHGQRPALFADGRVRWVPTGELDALIQAQKNVLEKAK